MKKMNFLLGCLIFGSAFAASAQVVEKMDAVTGSTSVRLTPAPQAEQATWIALSRVCFSTASYDSRKAQEACEDAAETVNLLANDRMVFQASCQPRLSEDRCAHPYSGYVLNVKALTVAP